MNRIFMKTVSLLMLVLTLSLLAPGESSRAHPQNQEEGFVKTYYNHLNDTTLVHMDLGVFHLTPPRGTKSLSMRLSAEYKGKKKVKPGLVRVEVSLRGRWSISDDQKPRLLIFSDKETLEASDSAKGYSPSLNFEWMSFTLPLDEFLQVAKARRLRPQIDGVDLELTATQSKWLRAFGKELERNTPFKESPALGTVQPDFLTLPGRVLGKGHNRKPVGQFKITTYLVEEVPLPQPIEIDIRGKKERVASAFRITIYGGPFATAGALAHVVWIGSENLGIGIEHPKLNAVTVGTLDRSLLREGATLVIHSGGIHTELPEKLKLDGSRKIQQ
jgi:hypothetical protein